MSDITKDEVRTIMEQLYDAAFQEGYKRAYEEMVPLLKAANDKVKEKLA